MSEFSLGEATLGTSADTSGLERDLNKAEQQTKGWLGRLEGVFQTAAGFLLGGLVQQGIAGIMSGIIALSSGMIQGNAQFEQYNTQFEVLLGSAEAAEQRMEELAEFGRTTPFDLPQVVEADRILQGFGLHAEEAAMRFGFSGEEIRRIAGDVASGTGSSFQEMALLLGKFSSGATGEAIARMMELGITNREELAKMGLDFSASGQLLSPLPEAMNVVLGLMQDKYGGLMEAQSSTFEGMMSNLRDWIDGTIREMGKPIFDAVKEQLGSLLEFLNTPEMQESVEKLGQEFANAARIIIEWVVPLIERILPQLPGLISDVSGAISGLIGAADLLLTGDFEGVFGRMFGLDEDSDIMIKIYELRDTIMSFAGPIMDWLNQNVSLQDILLGLGGVLTAVVIPAVIGFLAPILQVVAVVGVVIGVIALLRKAWEDDFGGIRTTVMGVWNDHLLPAFERIKEWAGEIIPPIIDNLKQAWENLQPGLQELARVFTEEILPLFGGESIDTLALLEIALDGLSWYLLTMSDGISVLATVVTDVIVAFGEFINWLQRTGEQANTTGNSIRDGINGAWQSVIDFWETKVKPPMDAVLAFFNDHIIPLFQSVGNVARELAELGLTVLAGVWQNVLQPALYSVWEFIDTHIMPIINLLIDQYIANLQTSIQFLSDLWTNTLLPGMHSVWEFIDTKILSIFRQVEEQVRGPLGQAMQWLKDNILDPLNTSFQNIGSTLDTITGQFNTLAGKLDQLDQKLPAWMRPGSPTPLEIGIKGINSAMSDWRQQLPSLASELNMNGELAMLAKQSSSREVEKHDHYNLTVNSNADRVDIPQEFHQQKAWAGRAT